MSRRPPTMADAGERGLIAARDADIHTFSNGTEWYSWADGNCYDCAFYDDDTAGLLCAFESAAFLHLVSPELAQLFGWVQRTAEYGPRDGWVPPQQCAFFRPKRNDEGGDNPPPPEPDPLQLVLLADPTEDAARLSAIVAEERQAVPV